jgi:hypothetical protein
MGGGTVSRRAPILWAVRLLLIGVALMAMALPAAASTARTQQMARTAKLSIAVWPQGTGAGKPVRRLSLTCNPAGGTHPAPRRACRRLFANLGAIRPVRQQAACAQRAGGPQKAFIRGSVNGRRIRAAFKRTNGCEIARWNRLRVLFPVRTPAPSTEGTSLKITVWPAGVTGASRVRTLICAPPGGTLANPAKACDALYAVRAPFAENESERACTMIWAGRQVAVVEGRFRGNAVRARFDRSDGCETDRWDRVAFLFVA